MIEYVHVRPTTIWLCSWLPPKLWSEWVVVG